MPSRSIQFAEIPRIPRLGVLFACSAGFLIAGVVGCAPVRPAPGETLSGPLTPPAPQQPTFTVEVRESGAEPRTKQLVLSEPITVQQLLEKTGVLSRFGRMDIELVRRIPGRREPLKLAVEFQHRVGRVAEHENYAIQPADHVVITEVRRTVVEDWLDQASEMLGPLATMR